MEGRVKEGKEVGGRERRKGRGGVMGRGWQQIEGEE